jgi:hypothetical protein
VHDEVFPLDDAEHLATPDYSRLRTKSGSIPEVYGGDFDHFISSVNETDRFEFQRRSVLASSPQSYLLPYLEDVDSALGSERVSEQQRAKVLSSEFYPMLLSRPESLIDRFHDGNERTLTTESFLRHLIAVDGSTFEPAQRQGANIQGGMQWRDNAAVWDANFRGELTHLLLSVAMRTKLSNSDGSLKYHADQLGGWTVGELSFATARFPKILQVLKWTARFPLNSTALIADFRSRTGNASFAWMTMTKMAVDDSRQDWLELTGWTVNDWLDRMNELGIDFDAARRFVTNGVYEPSLIAGAIENDIDAGLITQVRGMTL